MKILTRRRHTSAQQHNPDFSEKSAGVRIAPREITELEPSGEKNPDLMQQLAMRLINAQEEERQRISHELHDDLGSRIALLALSIRQAMKHADSSSNTQELAKTFDQLMDLSSVVRDLSHGLHPPLLQHVGIKAALRSHLENFQKVHGIRTGLAVSEGLTRLPCDIALCIFRVAQEALQNAAKHSGASQVNVSVVSTPRYIRLTVIDRGVGFLQSDAAARDGLGLLSMEARAIAVGGHLSVNSTPRSGTVVTLTIPLRQSHS